MSDWQVGDLAVCVDDSPGFRGVSCPCCKGRVYRVSGVHVARADCWDAGEIGLFLEGVSVPSRSGAINARRFRKVTPDKREACETEFVTLLKRSKRKVSA